MRNTITRPSDLYFSILMKPQCLEPSLAAAQVRVTISPSFQSSFFNPARCHVAGGLPSHPHCSTWPVVASFTSTHVAVCGLIQSMRLNTPVTDHSLLGSNSAEIEWCANTGTAPRIKPNATTNALRLIFRDLPIKLSSATHT